MQRAVEECLNSSIELESYSGNTFYYVKSQIQCYIELLPYFANGTFTPNLRRNFTNLLLFVIDYDEYIHTINK